MNASMGRGGRGRNNRSNTSIVNESSVTSSENLVAVGVTPESCRNKSTTNNRKKNQTTTSPSLPTDDPQNCNQSSSSSSSTSSDFERDASTISASVSQTV